MKPQIIEDRRYLVTGPDPADLAQVRLHRYVVLVVVGQDRDGVMRVKHVLGTVWSPSADWTPKTNDDSAEALRVLAANYAKAHRLADGAAFAVKALPLP